MHARLPSALLALTVTLCLSPLPAQAQTEPSWLVGAGSGIGWGTMTVDSEIGSATGPTFLALFGQSRGGFRVWSLEVEGHGFHVPNPVQDERFRAFRGLVRASFGRPFFVAPGLGIELRRWRGTAHRDEADLALYLSAGVGRHVDVGGDVVLLPEVSWGWSPLSRAETGSAAAVSLRLSAFWSGSG